MHGHALAAGHVADNLFAANGIATVGAIDQQIVVSGNFDGGGVAAEDAAHHAGESGRRIDIPVAVRWDLAAQLRLFRQHPGQNAAGGELAVAEGGEQVIRLGQSILAGHARQLRLADVLQRNVILAGFLLDQLAANFDGALALMDVQPVLDLLAGARRLGQLQPVAAGIDARAGSGSRRCRRSAVCSAGERCAR